MSNLTIERYTGPITATYAGLIEPADRSWIIYLDADGKPDTYWAHRDADGAVTGEPIAL